MLFTEKYIEITVNFEKYLLQEVGDSLCLTRLDLLLALDNSRSVKEFRTQKGVKADAYFFTNLFQPGMCWPIYTCLNPSCDQVFTSSISIGNCANQPLDYYNGPEKCECTAGLVSRADGLTLCVGSTDYHFCNRCIHCDEQCVIIGHRLPTEKDPYFVQFIPMDKIGERYVRSKGQIIFESDWDKKCVCGSPAYYLQYPCLCWLCGDGCAAMKYFKCEGCGHNKPSITTLKSYDRIKDKLAIGVFDQYGTGYDTYVDGVHYWTSEKERNQIFDNLLEKREKMKNLYIENV